MRAISESSAAVPVAHRPGGLTRRQLLAGIGVATGLVGGVLGWNLLLPKRSRNQIPPFYQRLTYRRGLIRTARFDPDFKTVYYGALWDGGFSSKL